MVMAEALNMRRLSRFGTIAAVGISAVVGEHAEADPNDPFQSAPIARPAPAPAPRPAPRAPRSEPEPAIYAPPPAATLQPRMLGNYDGSYMGSVRLQTGQSESNRIGTVGRGSGTAAYENCNSASIPQFIEISGGSFRYLFNQMDNVVITGRVDGSGVVSGFGNSPFGGARLSAQIVNGALTGTAESVGCRFVLDLRRR